MFFGIVHATNGFELNTQVIVRSAFVGSKDEGIGGNAERDGEVFDDLKRGLRAAAETQFWHITSPRNMSPEDFAKAFGIPKANTNSDFLIAGRLAPGKNAVTRIAPGSKKI